MKTYWEQIDETEKEGFTITIYAAPEDDSPDGHFASGDDAADKELLERIYNNDLAWFQVKCTASKNGIELATDYLGGCCYESYAEFIKCDDYAADMRKTVIAEAKEVITKLIA